MADLENEIKNAKPASEIQALSPVKTESAAEEIMVPADTHEFVDKAAQDRIEAEQKAARKAQREQERKQRKIDKKAKQAAAYQEKVEQCPRDYRPVKTGVFFWTEFLFAIPGIGLLFILLFSIFPINKNFKNYARAKLSWAVIGLIVVLIFAVISMFVMGQSVTDFIWPFEKFFSDMAAALGF